jgi:ABC-type sugar transport system ATPase subunit
MNLINGKFKNGKFQANDFPINIKIQHSIKIQPNSKITIGYRSEDIIIHNKRKPNTIKGSIFNIEALGKEQSIVIKINDKTEFVVTVSNNLDFTLYNEVYIELDNNKMHIFNTESKQRLN